MAGSLIAHSDKSASNVNTSPVTSAFENSNGILAVGPLSTGASEELGSFSTGDSGLGSFMTGESEELGTSALGCGNSAEAGNINVLVY